VSARGGKKNQGWPPIVRGLPGGTCPGRRPPENKLQGSRDHRVGVGGDPAGGRGVS